MPFSLWIAQILEMCYDKGNGRVCAGFRKGNGEHLKQAFEIERSAI